jgi:predicted ATPase
MGQSFDAQLLQEAADEHVVVVEVGLEILLKRWLIRQFADSWKTSRRERDIVLWAQGARRGSFEFAHKLIRNTVYHELNPLRRQAMHSQVAKALEHLRGEREPEALAYHFVEAGQWERALPHLQRAIDRALSVGAEETARLFCGQAQEVLNRLVAGARNAAQAERWREERERMQGFCDQPRAATRAAPT